MSGDNVIKVEAFKTSIEERKRILEDELERIRKEEEENEKLMRDGLDPEHRMSEESDAHSEHGIMPPDMIFDSLGRLIWPRG